MKQERLKKLKAKIDATNSFTKEDAKEVGLAIFEDKALFYSLLTGAGLFVITSAGLFASIGAGAMVAFGIRVKDAVAAKDVK